MCCKHQYLRFQYSCIAQWHVNSHLVTVEVGVERGTNEWVQLNSFTFNKFWLESLNTQTVQCRSTVQQYRVTFQDIFEDIPNHRIFPVYNLFSRFNGLYNPSF